MIRNIFIFLIALLWALSASASGFETENFTLKNGMQVVVIPNTKVPAVSHMVWYKAGAQDEVAGKSGLAHFLEHLMFKGTANFPRGQFSKMVSKAGGNDNAFTSADFTAYFQNIAKEKLPMVMELEADRMANLVFDEKEVDKERKVILEERSMRTDNDPSALLREQMRAALYLNHPYGRPIIGWRHEMEKLSPEDAKGWYESYYSPNNAILIVSGDITAKELKPLAEKYYGSITPRPVKERLLLSEPPQIAQRRLIVRDDKVNKPQWSRYYMAPSIMSKSDINTYALTLLSQILGEADTSRFYQNLVVDGQKASSIGSYYDDLMTGPSVFAISATPANNTSMEDMENAIDGEIAKIKKDGVTADELERAKKSLIADTIYAREDLKTLAYLYGQVMVMGLGTDYVNNWEDNIKSVTIEDVKKAANSVLILQNSVTGELRKQ